MKISPYIVLSLLSLLAIACSTSEAKQNQIVEKAIIEHMKGEMSSKADQLLEQCVKAHGGGRYKSAYYSFTFRKKRYTFQNEGDSYTYTMEGIVKGVEVKDVLRNGVFSRTVKGQLQELSEKEEAVYSESLNSVVYFATLPYKLLDKAVNKSYKGKVNIKGNTYEVLKITFDQEGGGKDFDDQYYYWINEKTYQVDYLAYNYQVNNGGVRFRSAYNKRRIGGITFQDYINYKAPLGTELSTLPSLYEQNQLEELSRIDTEDVKKLE